MAVRIRMKKMGRRHRPFFRICAMDARAPRDGKAIEELGYYDPMVPETDARAILKAERIDYWLSVGAQPSEKVAVLIKKYGKDGTHLEQQQQALDRIASAKPTIPEPYKPPEKKEEPAEEKAEEKAEGGEEAAAKEEKTEEKPEEQASGEEGAEAKAEQSAEGGEQSEEKSEG